MDLQQHLEQLKQRAKSKIGPVIAAYETKDWPPERLDELIAVGGLTEIDKATYIRCPFCYKRCPGIKPVLDIAKDGTEIYYILCSREGCNELDPFYLRRWQVSDKIHTLAPDKQKRKRRQSSALTKKEQTVYSAIHVLKKTQKEIAYEMGCSTQNVCRILKKAEIKVGLSQSRSVTKKQQLPKDKRGQAVVSGSED